jgi:acyl carrier protein
MSEPDLLGLVRRAAREVDSRDLPPLERAMPLEALMLDSLTLMQVVAFLEDELGVPLPAQGFSRARTVGDLVDVVTRALSAHPPFSSP